jgi:hypothetical protein
MTGQDEDGARSGGAAIADERLVCLRQGSAGRRSSARAGKTEREGMTGSRPRPAGLDGAVITLVRCSREAVGSRVVLFAQAGPACGSSSVSAARVRRMTHSRCVKRSFTSMTMQEAPSPGPALSPGRLGGGQHGCPTRPMTAPRLATGLVPPWHLRHSIVNVHDLLSTAVRASSNEM